MARRVLATATLAAAGLLTSGLVPLTGAASAAACPAWTDPAEDFAPLNKEQLKSSPGYANLDIVGAFVRFGAADVVTGVTVRDLDEAGYTGVGDRFIVTIRFDGTQILFEGNRSETGFTGKLQPPAGGTVGAATASIDHNTNTFLIRATMAELTKSVGKPVDGMTAAVVKAESGTAHGDAAFEYDKADAPADTAFTVGTACTGVAPDVALAWPADGCTTFTDGPGDGTPAVNAAATPNDADLDIVNVTLNSTASHFMAYVKVSALGAKPANFQGDRFEVSFKVGPKTFAFSGGRVALGKRVTPYPTRGQVNGANEPKLATSARFEQPKNTVVLLVDRAALDLVNGAPVADGATVTDVVAKSVALQGPQELPADTAQAADATKRTYTFGDSPCFGPPPSKLLYSGARTVQFGDAVALGAKLTTEAGAAIAGKAVKFELGGASVTATSNDAGVAATTLTTSLVAGAYNVVASFAGDPAAKAVSLTTPFTVTQEKTRITLAVAKSGTRRTVTAKLLDDDGKAVAGQVVAWYVNGRKVASPRTTSAGVVTLTTAKPTQTVKAVFTAVAGKYLGSSAQTKV